MFCAKCGRQVGADARFCPNCGLVITRISPEIVPTPKTQLKAADDGKTFALKLLGAMVASILVGLGILFLVLRDTSEPQQSVQVPTVHQAQPTPSPAQAPEIPIASVIQIPTDERDLISAISEFKSRYHDAPNEFQKSAIRRERAGAIARIVPDHSVTKWIGTISRMQTTSDGNGILSINPAGEKSISIGTWNNSLSDIGSRTLIPAASPLYEQISHLSIGDIVRFSGTFESAVSDFLKESSLTEAGSMAQPDFIFTFSNIRLSTAQDDSSVPRSIASPSVLHTPSPILQNTGSPEMREYGEHRACWIEIDPSSSLKKRVAKALTGAHMKSTTSLRTHIDGGNAEDNLQVLTRKKNRSKGAKARWKDEDT
jgi:hypothetical protein